MKLPLYHMPTVRNVAMRSWERLKTFIVGAGKVIVIMVVILSVLNLVGTDGSFDEVSPENSVLAGVSKAVVPVFEPMGMEQENWPAVVGIVSGVRAKEIVVGTLDSLYGALANDRAAEEEETDTRSSWQIVGDELAEAFATIPANLAALGDTVTDPLGLSVGDVDNIDTAVEEQEVATGTFGEMQARFAGIAGASGLPVVHVAIHALRGGRWRHLPRSGAGLDAVCGRLDDGRGLRHFGHRLPDLAVGHDAWNVPGLDRGGCRGLLARDLRDAAKGDASPRRRPADGRGIVQTVN